MNADIAHQPLAIVRRGDYPESIHYGSIAVTDTEGRLLASAGNPDWPTFMRSTAKPLQAIPLFSHPRLPELNLSDAHLAITCGSHSGEPRHLQMVREILERCDCARSDLKCGTHTPLYFDALERQPTYGDTYTSLHHNCSGKHAGLLAWCHLSDLAVEGYCNNEHPLQEQIRAVVAHYAGRPADELEAAIDGCGVASYRLPLSRIASIYAALASEKTDSPYADAQQRIFAAMTRHPEMVAGLRRIDLLLMHVGAGDWLTKVGAEALHALGIRSKGLGIAIKIADGGLRARSVITIEVLKQLGLITDITQTPLEEFAHPIIHNDRGQEVGDIIPCFELEPIH